MTTSLTYVLTLCLGFAGDGLAIGHLWSSDIGFNFKFAEHTIYDNFQVQLTHTTDNGLSGLCISMQLKGGVFLSQLIQGNSHLILVGTSFRLDSDRDDRLWESNRFENDRMVAVTKCITGEGVTQTDGGTDISRTNLVDILAVVGMHTQQATDTFRFILRTVLD